MEILNPTSSITIGCFLLFFFTLLTQQSFAARALGGNINAPPPPPPPPPGQIYQDHIAISFSMQDVLSGAGEHPTSKTNNRMHLPFSKPLLGYYPPIGGIPFSNLDAAEPLMTGTLDVDGISVSFPAVATLQELELGNVTTINVDIYDRSSLLLGKAQGIYVASSEDGNSHMMAMTASFTSNGYGDCLRFFGVHRTDVVESHVAVIGGSGKYHNANGYATIKTVNINSSSSVAADDEMQSDEEVYKLLLFNVNLG